VAATRPASPSAELLAVLPDEATPLEPAPRLDSVPITFGLVHTDSNMHVNSLAYLRMFEEAALRRFVELGRDVTTLLGRHIDIAYRKPCLAGRTMRVRQQAFEHGGRVGVAAALVPDGSPPAANPHTFMRMMFET
jgi:acyl-CoA thioesterase FadM